MKLKLLTTGILTGLLLVLLPFSCKNKNEDTEAPAIVLSSHQNGDYVKGAVTLSGTASDNEGVESVKISLDEGRNYTEAAGIEEWSYDFDTSGYPDGTISIALKIKDINSLTNFSFVTLIVDNNGPSELTVTSPQANAEVNGVVQIRGITSDSMAIKKVEVKVGSGSFVAAAGTSNWSYQFDSTTYAEGSYDITIRATDLSGNYTDEVVPIQINQASDKPVLTIINPSDGQKVSGFLSIVGMAEDDEGIQKVQIKFDSGDWVDATGTNTWSKIWDTTVVPEGMHDISIQATDDNGLVSDILTISVDVDQTTPSINIDTPAVNDYLKGSNLTVSGTASDNIGIGKVEISLDGGSNYALVDTLTDNGGGNYSWSHSIDTTVLADGSLTFFARAIDSTGLLGTTSVAITVDNAPPGVTFTSHASGEMMQGLVTLTGTSADTIGVANVEVNVASTGWTPVSGTTDWTIDYDTSALNLIGTVSVRATDFSGNQTSSDISGIIFDQVLPQITAIEANTVSLADGDKLQGIVTFSGNVAFNPAASGVITESVQVKIGTGGFVAATLTAPTWTVDYDTVPFTDGVYDVVIRATDSLGGLTDVTFSVLVDNTDPVVTLDSPVDNGTVGLSALITGTVSDSGGIASVRIQVDDASSIGLPYELDVLADINGTNWSYNWDATPFSVMPGHKIYITATDLAGNTGNPAVNPTTVERNNAVPSVSITTHTSGDHTRQTISLGGSASDNGTVDSVEVFINAVSQGTATLNPGPAASLTWSMDIDTTGFTDGEYAVRVRATDNDTTTTDAEIYLTVDNTPPTVSILSPDGSETGANALFGTITLSGSASDLNLASVLVDADGLGYNPAAGTSAWSFDWDSSVLPTIAKTGVLLNAKAVDLAGNESVISTVTVDIRPEISTISSDSASIGDVITLTGFNFDPADNPVVISFDGVAAVTASAADSQNITVTVPAGATSGPVVVKTNNISSNAVNLNIWDAQEIDSQGYNGSLAIDKGTGDIYITGGASYKQGPTNYRVARFHKFSGGVTGSPVLLHSSAQNGDSVTYSATSIVLPNVYSFYIFSKENNLQLAKSQNSGTSFLAPVTIDSSASYISAAASGIGDGSDKLWVSYYKGGSLMMAKSTDAGGTFSTEVVDSSGDVGQFSTISLDSSGNPHIGYYDASNRALKVAYFNGSSWQISVVDSGYVGEYASLSVAPDDSVHVSYYDANSGDLKYGRSATPGGSFITEAVDIPLITGWFSAIATDSLSAPHIAYINFSENKLFYADETGADWKSQSVPDPGAVTAGHIRIATDGSDLANILYLQGGIKLARFMP